jgi:hypothetical protein
MSRQTAILRRVAVLLPAILILTSCFEIEQDITVDQKLKGDAGLRIAVDFEPMVVIMATMGRQMEGKEGPPSKEELDKIRADFQSKSSAEQSEPISLEKANADMPEGVKVLAADMKQEGMKLVSTFRFGFDRLNQLASVKMPAKDEAATDPTKQNVIESPFEGIEVEESKGLITIRSKPQNPADKVEQQATESGPPMDPETEKMMEEAFKNLRFTFRLTAPFEVVSHNATRREGDTLIWDYDLKRMEALEKSGAKDAGIEVKYRR